MGSRNDSMAYRDVNTLWKGYHDEILLIQPLSLLSKTNKGRALDLGSGDAHSLSIMNSYGFSSVGLDIVSQGRDTVQGSGTKMPFKDRSFNVVVCLRTLQHIKEESETLKEIHRVLEQGGCLVLAVANFRSFTMVFLKSKGQWRREESVPYGWFKVYKEEELVELLKSHGFIILDKDVVGYLPDIVRRRFPSITKILLKIIKKMDRLLKSIPIISKRGTLLRVVARSR